MGEPQEEMGSGALLPPPNLGEQNGNKRFREGRGGEGWFLRVAGGGGIGKGGREILQRGGEGKPSLKAVRGMSDRQRNE